MDGFADQGQRNGVIERILRGPYAGAFLPGPVENLVDQWAAVAVALTQYPAGNFDQIGFKATTIPGREAVGHFIVTEAKRMLHQVANFGDQLHVAVFDAVVNHLDVMAAMAWNMSRMLGQAAAAPPGISDGPKRAPSSPPETPMPTK